MAYGPWLRRNAAPLRRRTISNNSAIANALMSYRAQRTGDAAPIGGAGNSRRYGMLYANRTMSVAPMLLEPLDLTTPTFGACQAALLLLSVNTSVPEI